VKLYAKLVLIMLSLLVIAVVALFLLNQYSQNDLVSEIQESSMEVSKAIQLSVEGLTSEYEPDMARLKEYLKEAKAKGINEINIISNEGEIIESSDPSKVGKKKDIRRIEPGLKASKLPKGVAAPIHPYDLVVPVIVGDQHLGYVHINLLLDNIRELQHTNFVRRLITTFLVFALGIVVTVFLARRYIAPINRLAAGVRQVADGDLSVTFPAHGQDEIGQLGESFNEMVQKLREREQLEKQLLEAEHLSTVGRLASGIAHEIRNPLNYISLAIDHLKGDLQTTCPDGHAAVAPLADRIKEEVRRANYLVLTFMNYGRPLKLRLGTFSYSDLVERTLPLFQERVEDKGIRFLNRIPFPFPPMTADAEMLKNCLVNLISNAIQAMDDGGTITLDAFHDQQLRQFRLSVTDDGPGIPAEDLERIFQPYFTSREAGIGLGLAITERIIKTHGGSILVESKPGSGTTFSLVIPELPADEPPVPITP
jgi:hypothetical protein